MSIYKNQFLKFCTISSSSSFGRLWAIHFFRWVKFITIFISCFACFASFAFIEIQLYINKKCAKKWQDRRHTSIFMHDIKSSKAESKQEAQEAKYASSKCKQQQYESTRTHIHFTHTQWTKMIKVFFYYWKSKVIKVKRNYNF